MHFFKSSRIADRGTSAHWSRPISQPDTRCQYSLKKSLPCFLAIKFHLPADIFTMCFPIFRDDARHGWGSCRRVFLSRTNSEPSLSSVQGRPYLRNTCLAPDRSICNVDRKHNVVVLFVSTRPSSSLIDSIKPIKLERSGEHRGPSGSSRPPERNSTFLSRESAVCS